MDNLICVDKVRKNNKIIKYNLIYSNNRQVNFYADADKLKSDIKEGKVNVINLKLTTDNRLVDVKIKEEPKICVETFESEMNDAIIIRDNKIRPYDSEDYTEFIGRLIYLLEKSLKIKESNGYTKVDNTNVINEKLTSLDVDLIVKNKFKVNVIYKYNKDGTLGTLDINVFDRNGKYVKSSGLSYGFENNINMKADFMYMLKVANKARILALNL